MPPRFVFYRWNKSGCLKRKTPLVVWNNLARKEHTEQRIAASVLAEKSLQWLPDDRVWESLWIWHQNVNNNSTSANLIWAPIRGDSKQIDFSHFSDPQLIKATMCEQTGTKYQSSPLFDIMWCAPINAPFSPLLLLFHFVRENVSPIVTHFFFCFVRISDNNKGSHIALLLLYVPIRLRFLITFCGTRVNMEHVGESRTNRKAFSYLALFHKS